MTRQEIFDIVLKGIVSQGGPAYDYEHNSCVYRDDRGRKCAAGWIIPDENFLFRWNTAIIHQEAASMLPKELRDADTLRFLRALQNIHDENAEIYREDEFFLPAWMKQMAEFAKNNDLEFKP